jgi:hypothetical protein
MKKTIIVTLISFFFSASLYATEKKISTTEKSKEQVNTLIEKIKGQDIKLNTKSKLTDWITGKKKFSDSVPNPINGLKNIKKAVTPDNPLKK